MPTTDDIETEAATQRAKLAPRALYAIREVMSICASSPIPAGWIKVNDHWDPTSCGNPSIISYNVLTIERYDTKPVGDVMTVCAEAPTPVGWVEVSNHWDPTSCGHPTVIVPNVKQIRRVS